MVMRWLIGLVCMVSAWAETDATHWSLRPLNAPPPPEVHETNWIVTPIDRFILNRLEKEGMRPSPKADARTLLRRVCFDLIGLPPTPDQLAAFEKDPKDQHLEKIVDSLLSSPRYGERWARHWLDIVHFAETHGHDQDRIRTNAWPYRDYVIESFNSDKRYARFIEEQIAGDVLFPETPEGIVAMGFLAAGPWDESSLRDIREDTLDRQIARYLDRDDIVATVMNTFVSTTAQCARCHDHKFDPVSQREYYNLQAVFAATDKANRAYDPDPKVHQKRRELMQRKQQIAERSPALLAELNSDRFRKRVFDWEAREGSSAAAWEVMIPESVSSAEGAIVTIQNDGTVLSTGPRPDTDVYTAELKASGLVTAIRLEVLTDALLPQGGPGRQDNGNLHLTDLRVFYSPEGAVEEKEIVLQNPSADFNQQDWGIARAIDADAKSAWGIYPQVGKNHHAVFELQTAEELAGRLRVVLAQNHGGGHLIGKFRISVTSRSHPVRASELPDEIARILSRSSRTETDYLQLAWHVAREETEQELAALPKRAAVFAGASDFEADGGFKPAGTPREVRVLRRGEIKQPGEIANPGALSCVPGMKGDFELTTVQDEGARRAALARWISARENVLTWRSIVNRVWQYHFGRGIAQMPGDLGKMGGEPSHPAMLDWLAVWFRDQGGSFKQLHKLIVTSAVYQQDSADVPEYSARDADNTLLWRMNRTRLDAECVRDAILQITGKLDLKMGGPSVQQFVLSPPIHVTPGVDYSAFDVDAPESLRRSVYRFIFRTLPDPFMDSLDCPDSSQFTHTRNNSVTVLQALAMLNNRFVTRQSEHFASRLESLRPNDLPAQINLAFELATARTPRASELELMVPYTEKHGLSNLCRVLFNSNEFIFVN